MSGIRYSFERQFFFLPVFPKRIGGFRPENQYFRIPFGEGIIIMTQLRQVPLTKWSDKPPVEHQKRIFVMEIIGQANGLVSEVFQNKIRCGLIQFNPAHGGISFQKGAAWTRTYVAVNTYFERTSP